MVRFCGYYRFFMKSSSQESLFFLFDFVVFSYRKEMTFRKHKR